MADSFLDNERSTEKVNNIEIRSKILENATVHHEGPSEEISENILLAAGDNNRNAICNKNTSGNSAEFIAEETVPSSTSHTSAKRKREQSPDISEKELEEIDGKENSDADTDAEDSVLDLDSSPHTPKTVDEPSKNLSKTVNIDEELPDTVTLLKTPGGAKVYLVGTAHFSIESQEDVAKIIQAVQPHVVLVELCKARVNILQLDEETILEEAKNINFEKIHSTIKKNGLFHGMMYILLLSVSAHITKQLGMAPGGEFRRAFAEAKKFPHCIVHLGDRPIHVTLQRAISSLSWWQTIKVTWHLIMSKGPISKEEVERCKRRDLLEEMLAEMTGEFPDLSNVFVKERDIYLAHSLQLAAAIPQSLHLCGQPPRVVGVVGIGHVSGIVEHWGKVQPDDIPPLLYIPPPTLTSRVIRVGAKLSVLGLVLWGCSRILPIQKITPKLSDLKNVVQNALQ